MARQWAIVIGVNQYSRMESLRYASQDATAIRDFLAGPARFSQVYWFSDDSPDTTIDGGVSLPTAPTLANLRRFLEVRFATPFAEPEDTLWFFFSGHGLNFGNRDYLLLSDADPDDAESTAIALDDLADCLQRCGTRKIVLVLDACRTEEQKFGQGFGTDPEGVITLFGSNFNQTAAEVDEVQHGAFTYMLLKALRPPIRYRGVTLRQLHNYLQDNVPKFALRSGRPPQVPRMHADGDFSLDRITVPIVPLVPLRQALFTPAAALVGAAVLLGVGVVGYSMYQGSVRNATATQPKKLNSDRSAHNGNASSSTAQPTSSKTDISDQLGSLELNLKDGVPIPKTGTYYTTMPQASGSRREIGRNGDRYCIRVVNTSTKTATGFRSQVLISSVSLRPDGMYVNATQEKYQIVPTATEMTDSKGVIWQRLKNQIDDTGLMAECLASSQPFMRQTKEE